MWWVFFSSVIQLLNFVLEMSQTEDCINEKHDLKKHQINIYLFYTKCGKKKTLNTIA